MLGKALIRLKYGKYSKLWRKYSTVRKLVLASTVLYLPITPSLISHLHKLKVIFTKTKGMHAKERHFGPTCKSEFIQIASMLKRILNTICVNLLSLQLLADFKIF